jgi:nucleoside 2-deoxyribosyltransferase
VVGHPRPVVYLAGFDVFRPDAAAYGASLKVLCDELGFTGIFPLDAEFEADLAPAIRRAASTRATSRRSRPATS